MAGYGKILVLSLLSAVIVCAGCKREIAPITYYLPKPRNLLDIRRVVLVELEAVKGTPDIAEKMTEALFTAIQSRKLFHVDVISRTNPACRDLSLNKREGFTIKEMEFIRDELKCDAVIFGSVRHFETYPSMQIGLYLRLVDLRAGEVVWGVDCYTWDTTDKATEKRMKKFFDRQIRAGYDPVNWQLLRMSIRMFQKFVACEVASTLPTPEEIVEAAQR